MTELFYSDEVLSIVPGELGSLPGIETMSILRGLERVECQVTQYANPEEAVMPISEILTRISVDIPRAFTVFQSQANISGMC